jgi:predicted ABC-type ATPase
MSRKARPQLVIVAGPNGAGKSTFYDSHLAESPLPFLNADILASRTGIDSFEAARFLDALRGELIEQGRSFITETVFSDPVGAKLAMLRKAVAAGYEVILIYVGIEADLAGLRVEQRVAAGGHDVPRDKLLTRFERSLENLREALKLAIMVKVYDNSRADEPHRLLAVFENGSRTFIASRLPRWVRSVLVSPRSRQTRQRSRRK